jgi:hypothetical protein
MYSYDRRTASSTEGILRLILRGVQSGRSTASLVRAYIDEVLEDLEADDRGEPGALTIPERDRWYQDEVGVLLSQSDVEKALQDAYVRLYMRLVPWATKQTAQEVYDHPPGFPEEVVPAVVVEAVARQMATQDASDAHALRDRAMHQSSFSH